MLYISIEIPNNIETLKVQRVYSSKELKHTKENAVPNKNNLFYPFYSSHLWFQNSPFNAKAAI